MKVMMILIVLLFTVNVIAQQTVTIKYNNKVYTLVKTVANPDGSIYSCEYEDGERIQYEKMHPIRAMDCWSSTVHKYRLFHSKIIGEIDGYTVWLLEHEWKEVVRDRSIK